MVFFAVTEACYQWMSILINTCDTCKTQDKQLRFYTWYNTALHHVVLIPGDVYDSIGVLMLSAV